MKIQSWGLGDVKHCWSYLFRVFCYSHWAVDGATKQEAERGKVYANKKMVQNTDD